MDLKCLVTFQQARQLIICKVWERLGGAGVVGCRFYELLDSSGDGMWFIDRFVDHHHRGAGGGEAQSQEEPEVRQCFGRMEDGDGGNGVDDGGTCKNKRGDIDGGPFAASGHREDHTQRTDGARGSSQDAPGNRTGIKVGDPFDCRVFSQYENESERRPGSRQLPQTGRHADYCAVSGRRYEREAHKSPTRVRHRQQRLRQSSISTFFKLLKYWRGGINSIGETTLYL